MEVSIINTEKIVRTNHPDWDYKRIKGTAFYIRAGELRDRAYLLGVRLGGKTRCLEN